MSTCLSVESVCSRLSIDDWWVIPRDEHCYGCSILGSPFVNFLFTIASSRGTLSRRGWKTGVISCLGNMKKRPPAPFADEIEGLFVLKKRLTNWRIFTEISWLVTREEIHFWLLPWGGLLPSDSWGLPQDFLLHRCWPPSPQANTASPAASTLLFQCWYRNSDIVKPTTVMQIHQLEVITLAVGV